MNTPRISLVDSIKSDTDLRDQYKDSANLNARAAIYRFRIAPQTWMQWVFAQLLAKIPSTANVLEVGCGPGGLWRENLPRVPAGWRITLTDLMTGMCDETRNALAGNSRFTVAQMNVEQLDLPDKTFDAVIANHMLYHVPDIHRALTEIRRVLKPDGKLFAGTNGEQHMARLKELAAVFMPLTGSTSELPFSLENGGPLLRQVFNKIEIRRQSDELRITEVDAVVRYILSIQGAPAVIHGERLQQLQKMVDDEIQKHGAMIVPIEAGLFIAGNPQ